MGERRTNGSILCCWSHCHSISELWSGNQYCLQTRYHIPCHSWRHPHYRCPDFTTMSFQTLRKKNNGCVANIFNMYLNFYARWIMRVISKFMHLHIRTMRLCAYLNLLVLENVGSCASVGCNYMYRNICKWHISIRAIIIKISNKLKVV